MQSIYEVIKKPLITEKTNQAQEILKELVLKVDIEATKPQIKQAVETLFSVKVVCVRTAIVHGKVKRRGRSIVKQPNWKKAFVRLQVSASQKEFPIDFYNLGVS